MLLNNPITILFFVIGPFSLTLLGLITCTAVSSPPVATPPDSPTPAQEEISSSPPASPALPPTATPVLPPSPTLPEPTILTPTIYIVQFKQDLNSQQQTEFISAMEQRLRRRIEVLYRYETAYNGLAVFLTPQEALQVAEMDAVRQVQPDYPRSLQDPGGQE